ncbi:MAG TPA: YggT family protein [Candidatus Saccharimonadales bacterium]
MQDPKGTASSLTMLFVGLAEVVLGVRVVFRLIDADTTNSLVQWFYAMSEPLLEPVKDLIGPNEFTQRFVLDFRALLGMAVIAVAGYVALGILEWVRKPRLERDAGWRHWLRSRI